METIGRVSLTMSEEFKNEYLFLQNIPNKSKFICNALKSYLADENNLNEFEKNIKQHIFQQEK